MKTQILALSTKDWKFKADNGNELSGVSLNFMLDSHTVEKTTVTDELLKLVQSTKLPALFEAEVSVSLKRNNGKNSLKYEILTLKFVKDIQIFTK